MEAARPNYDIVVKPDLGRIGLDILHRLKETVHQDVARRIFEFRGIWMDRKDWILQRLVCRSALTFLLTMGVDESCVYEDSIVINEYGYKAYVYSPGDEDTEFKKDLQSDEGYLSAVVFSKLDGRPFRVTKHICLTKLCKAAHVVGNPIEYFLRHRLSMMQTHAFRPTNNVVGTVVSNTNRFYGYSDSSEYFVKDEYHLWMYKMFEIEKILGTTTRHNYICKLFDGRIVNVPLSLAMMIPAMEHVGARTSMINLSELITSHRSMTPYVDVSSSAYTPNLLASLPEFSAPLIPVEPFNFDESDDSDTFISESTFE